VQGLAGNVRPRVLADPAGGRFRKSSSEDLDQAGLYLAKDVLEALDSSGETLDLDIAAAVGWLPAHRDPDRVPTREHWVAKARSGDELGQNLSAYWLDRLDSGLPMARMVPWDVGLVRLTRQHYVAWLAGEPVAEWLPILRQCLHERSLVTLGYCQGLPGYLPTDEMLAEGGYEVLQSSWYRKTGPGPLGQGLKGSAKRRFAALARQLEAED
jgi:hypothetical protein